MKAPGDGLKIHRVTRGTTCSQMQGLCRVSYAFWTSSEMSRKLFFLSGLSSKLRREFRVRKVQNILHANFFMFILLISKFFKKPNCTRRSGSCNFSFLKNSLAQAGAIIGDGDRKRPPFQVLGLAPWYGTIFLFLEQIAPSPAAHARTCCEDFCECRAGEMASEIHEIFYAFGPQLNRTWRLRLLEFGLSIFVVSCSSLSEVRQCRI